MKTLETVKKSNLASAKNQSKPIQVTPKIVTWWTQCEKIATSAGMIPTELRIASRTNGATRRTWCENNPKSVYVVVVSSIANKVGDRPENIVRAKFQVLAKLKGNTTTKKLGYIRVLDKSVADSVHDPKFDRKSEWGKYVLANLDTVYIYRLAK